jgi:hypothetical protein
MRGIFSFSGIILPGILFGTWYLPGFGPAAAGLAVGRHLRVPGLPYDWQINRHQAGSRDCRPGAD